MPGRPLAGRAPRGMHRRAQGGAGLRLALVAACLWAPRASGLLDPGKWLGVVPRLAQDNHRADCHRSLMDPSAAMSLDAWEESTALLPGLDIPQGTLEKMPDIPIAESVMRKFDGGWGPGRMEASNPGGGMLASLPVLGAPLSVMTPLSESEHRLFNEGQKLWENMVNLRTKLAEQPSLFGTEEGSKLLDEFTTLQRSLEDIKEDLEHSPRPIVSNLLTAINETSTPLKGVLAARTGEVLAKCAGVVLSPVFGAALKNIQLVSGALAVAEVVTVTSRITASCMGKESSATHRALLHIQRAENGLVSASSVMDRILSDVLARRPVEKADAHIFGVEQHDVAVQLANVRSQLEAAREAACNQAKMHGGKARRWAVAAAILAATSHIATLVNGVLGAAATGVVATAAAANAACAVSKGRLLSEVEALQMRHDDALTEYTGLQAQFDEATTELEPEGPGNERMTGAQAVQEYALRDGVKVPMVYEGQAGTGDVRVVQREDVMSVLKELVNTATNSTVGGRSGHVRELLGQLGLASSGRVVGAANGSGTPRPSGLRQPSKGLSMTPPPMSGRASPRPSGLRPPSVDPRALETASPPPATTLPSTRPSGLRPPSFTPPPAGPATPTKREARTPRSVFARMTATPGVDGGGGRTSHVNLAENAVGRKLEEQLLILLHARIDVAEDDAKKEELRVLASQLREATRAARQQVKACERTETVLQDCMDPTLRERIMDAQQEATNRTQDAMRECLKATMVALEEEFKAKEDTQAQAGLAQDTDMATKVAATLEDARAILRASVTPAPPRAATARAASLEARWTVTPTPGPPRHSSSHEHTGTVTPTPGPRGTVTPSPRGTVTPTPGPRGTVTPTPGPPRSGTAGIGSRGGSVGVLTPMRAATAGARGASMGARGSSMGEMGASVGLDPARAASVELRKSAALEQFMKRQAAAAARNLARRTASAEAATPNASLSPKAKAKPEVPESLSPKAKTSAPESVSPKAKTSAPESLSPKAKAKAGETGEKKQSEEPAAATSAAAPQASKTPEVTPPAAKTPEPMPQATVTPKSKKSLSPRSKKLAEETVVAPLPPPQGSGATATASPQRRRAVLVPA